MIYFYLIIRFLLTLAKWFIIFIESTKKVYCSIVEQLFYRRMKLQMAFLKLLENHAFQAFRGAICSSYADKGQLFDTTCAWRDLFIHTSEDECKWFIAIWFILLKQSKARWLDTWIWWHATLLLFTYKMVIIHSNYGLCARCVLFVMLDSSSSLPGCSMELLLLLCCWSTAYIAPRMEGRALPHSPHPGWPISLRVQAPSRFFVGYTAMWLLTSHYIPEQDGFW
jgi:hypothetical protein